MGTAPSTPGSVPPPDTAVVVAIVKNEEPYLQEWVTYHVLRGFSRVYLYDNSDGNVLKDFAWKAPTEGRVVIRHWPGLTQQRPAYNHALDTLKGVHTWAAFIDADEFVMPRIYDNVVDLLTAACETGVLGLNWIMFGTSFREEPGVGPVLQRFQLRSSTINQHIKSIVRLEDALSFPENPHTCTTRPETTVHDVYGRTIVGPFHKEGDDHVACIHHYFTKSMQEAMQKRARGRSDGDPKARIRSASEFSHQSDNDVHDDRAWKWFQSALAQHGFSL